jgi:hypothetical protein
MPPVKGNFNVLFQRMHAGRIYRGCSRMYSLRS